MRFHLKQIVTLDLHFNNKFKFKIDLSVGCRAYEFTHEFSAIYT